MIKYYFGNSGSDDSGGFNEDDEVQEGIDKHDEYIENCERDEDDNPTEDIDEYYERQEEVQEEDNDNEDEE